VGAKEAPKEVAGCDVQALGAAPQQRADRGRSERRVPEHGGSHLHGKACDGASWKRIPAFRRQEVLSPWASRREEVRDAAHQVGPCVDDRAGEGDPPQGDSITISLVEQSQVASGR